MITEIHKMKVQGVKAGSKTSTYALVSHTDDEKTKSLSLTEPTTCFNLFSIVIDPHTGDALVERSMREDQGSESVATLNDEPLMDITHISPGSEFEIGGEKYSYLRPLDTLVVGAKASPIDRLLSLAKSLESSARLTNLLTSPKIANANAIEPSAEIPLVGQNIVRMPTPKVIKLANKKPVRTKRLTVAAVIMIAALGGAAWYSKRNHSTLDIGADTKKSTSQAQVSTEKPAGTLPKITPEAKAPEVTGIPVQANALVPENAQAILAVPATVKSALKSVKAATGSSVTAAVAQQKKPEAHSDASSRLPQQLSDPMRQKVAEYVLESRFDPNGATKKLEELKGKLAAGSPGRSEIQRRIDSIR